MMTNPEIGRDGTKRWRNEKGQTHREDGPAIIYPDGSKSWCRNGKLHRVDGPAVIHSDGYEAWWRNGKRHREDGPAVIYPNGDEYWYVNGKYIDINPILESFDVSSDWRSWTDAEKMIVRLALP